MKISVIVPVYNVERFLSRCIDSVLLAASRLASHDALSSTEVICVDDGSTDSSPSILAQYADRVKVVTKQNGGLGSARNAGLAEVTGEAVVFVDSDDFLPPDALVTFVEVAKSSGAALVVSRQFGRGDERSLPGDFDTRRQKAGWRMRSRGWIVGEKVQYSACNKLYGRELLVGRRFPAGKFEDFSWTTGIFCDVESFAVVDEPLYVYCQNAGATSIVRSSYTDEKNADSMAAIRRVLDYGCGRPCADFAACQAADGLSSTIGQVYKAGDRQIAQTFVDRYARLLRDYPELKSRLSLKARWRMWRLLRMR